MTRRQSVFCVLESRAIHYTSVTSLFDDYLSCFSVELNRVKGENMISFLLPLVHVLIIQFKAKYIIFAHVKFPATCSSFFKWKWSAQNFSRVYAKQKL